MIIAKIILILSLTLVVLYLIYDYFTKPYVNRYQINFLVGKPSAGKTLTLVKIAHDAFLKGYHVFSTEKYYIPIKVSRHEKVIMETVTIDAKALYRYQFPPRSVVLLDEVGLIYNNRNWKKFDERLKESWKLYRHDRTTYWIASQNLDADKVLRDLVTQYWLLERKFRIFTIARRLRAKQQVVQPTADSPGTIQDGFVEDPKFMRPVFGGMMITFIPKWVGCYDSYEIPEHMKKLRDIDYSDLPVPYSGKPKKTKKKRSKKQVKQLPNSLYSENGA